MDAIKTDEPPATSRKESEMRRRFEIGGIAAVVVLAVFGVLNASYLAENVAMFGIVVLAGSLRKHERFRTRTPESAGTKTAPVA